MSKDVSELSAFTYRTSGKLRRLVFGFMVVCICYTGTGFHKLLLGDFIVIGKKVVSSTHVTNRSF